MVEPASCETTGSLDEFWPKSPETARDEVQVAKVHKYVLQVLQEVLAGYRSSISQSEESGRYAPALLVGE